MVEQSAFPVQQLYLPAALPLLDGLLYLQVGQLTVTPLHLVSSFSQHVSVVSIEVHVEPAQYVVAAAAICFLPGAHETDAAEHFATFEQHKGAVKPAAPYLAGSLNLPAAHVAVDARHLPAVVSQHVA
jgi:hypothetical protein